MIYLRRPFLWVWVVVAVLIGCRRCNAQVFLVKTEIRACTLVDCRIEVGTASSVCVGRGNDRWYFITAGHAFYSQRPEVTTCKVLSAHVAIDRQWVPATVETFDQPGATADLGLLSVTPTGNLHCLPIAEHALPVGSEVTIGGFPSGSPYAEVTGNILARHTGDRQTDFLVSTAVVRGVSGGPVLRGGKIVGIVSASDFGSGTWCVGPEKIRQRLIARLGKLPDCGRPVPQLPPQNEGGHAPPWKPEPIPDPISTPLPAPPAEGPDIGVAAGGIASSAWTYLWPTLAGALGLSGPIGIAVYMAGRLIASRIGPKIAQRVTDRFHPLHPTFPQPASQTQDSFGQTQFVPVTQPQSQAVPVPVHVPIQTTQNRYVDVPVINNEAEALKEAMRLEAEFTKSDKPEVSQHLRRVQDMADMILKGQKIEKPGWKI